MKNLIGAKRRIGLITCGTENKIFVHGRAPLSPKLSGPLQSSLPPPVPEPYAYHSYGPRHLIGNHYVK